MKNANSIVYLERAVASIEFLATDADALSLDLSPMPDGSGIIADRFRACVLKLEAPGEKLLKAITNQQRKVMDSAVIAEAADPKKAAKTGNTALPVDTGKVTEAGKTDVAGKVSPESARPDEKGDRKTPGTTQTPVLASPARKPAAPKLNPPSLGPAGIRPIPFKKMAGC